MTEATPSAAEFAELEQAYARRLARLDRRLPAPAPLDTERLLIHRAGDSTAVGSWRRSDVDPRSYAAAFSAACSYRLRVRTDGPDKQSAVAGLLDRWADALREDRHTLSPDAAPPDGLEDVEASVSWPARDVDGVTALVRRGFFPDNVLAVRSRLDVDPELESVTDLVLRPAGPDDLDVVVATHLEELVFDDRLGGMHLRPSTEPALRAQEAAALSRRDGSRILAERDGRAIGLAVVSPPSEASWVAGQVAAERPGYLDCLSVTDTERSTGVGRLLAAAAHRHLAAAGADVALLHHSVISPRSVRFWTLQGYRPLWTLWSIPLSRFLG